MDKSKKTVVVKNTCSGKFQLYHQNPIPRCTEKASWVFLFTTSPGYMYNCYFQFHRSAIHHSHVIYHELLIVDKWTARAAGIAHTLLLDLCEQERSRQFGHFDCSIPNFNHFAPCFALSMQCIFWTVLLINNFIYKLLMVGVVPYYHNFPLHYLAAVWSHLINYAIGQSQRRYDTSGAIRKNNTTPRDKLYNSTWSIAPYCTTRVVPPQHP